MSSFSSSSAVPELDIKKLKPPLPPITGSYDPTLFALPIGEGNFAKVFHSKHNDEAVAVKRYKSSDSTINNEILALLVSSFHSHVVGVRGIVPLHNGTVLLVTEFVDGGTLQRITKRQSPEIPSHLSELQLVAILRQIASALIFIHDPSVNLRHGDIAARNILLRVGFTHALLADFGLATTIGAPGLKQWPKTHAAPEVMRDATAPSAASADIYSFGVVMWECSMGCLPYNNGADAEVVRAVERALACDAMEEYSNPTYVQIARACLLESATIRPTAQTLSERLVELHSTLSQPASRKRDANDNADGFDSDGYSGVPDNVTRRNDVVVDGPRVLNRNALQAQGHAFSRAWMAAASMEESMQHYQLIRVHEDFGKLVDEFLPAMVYPQEFSSKPVATLPRDAQWNARLRRIVVAGRASSNDLRTPEQHLHCVRGAELAFFADCVYKRHVLLRDDPNFSNSIVEQRSVEQVLSLLPSADHRRKLIEYAERAVRYFLPWDRAFALFSTRMDQHSHWFNEHHANSIDARGQAQHAALRLLRDAFSDTGQRVRDGRANKMWRFLLQIAGARTTERLQGFLEPLFWVKCEHDSNRFRLHSWNEATGDLSPFPSADDNDPVWFRSNDPTEV